MDEKKRKELIETIKTRVEVWDNKTYEFADYIDVTLENGNRFQAYKLRIERHDVYDDVMVSLYDDFTGSSECYLQHLTDDSLEKAAQELPLTHTIFVTAHTDGEKDSFCVCSVPVPCVFQTSEDLEIWLNKNFPALDWEQDDAISFVCYTERTDHTGPYLLAELIDSE